MRISSLSKRFAARFAAGRRGARWRGVAGRCDRRRIGIRAEHIDKASQPAQEVCRFGAGQLERAILERLHGRVGATGEDEDGRTDRADDPVLNKSAVLHRRQEADEPAQLAAVQRAIELIPENERQELAQAEIANLLKRVRQIGQILELRKIEFERTQPISLGCDDRGHLLDRKRLCRNRAVRTPPRFSGRGPGQDSPGIRR